MTSNSSQSLHGFPNHDALMIELGTALYEEAGIMGARPPSAAELFDLARGWLKDARQEISTLIDSNPEIKRLAYEPKPRDTQRLVALVSDGLSSPFTGFPILTASLLIVHFYLDHYIAEHDESID